MRIVDLHAGVGVAPNATEENQTPTEVRHLASLAVAYAF